MVEDSKEAERELPPPSQQQQQQQQQQHHTRKSLGNEDFTRTISKIAVAQICESEGFQGFQQSALEALSDVAVRYVKELGKASNLYANLAGRSECNVFDLIQGLEDLGLVQGFPGASDVHRSLAKSGVIREIGQYVNFIENVPFAFDVPRFQVSKECKLSPSYLQLGDEPPGEHIPAWLPAFPGVENQSDGSPDGNVGSSRAGQGVEVANDEQRDQHLFVNDRIEANVNPFLAPPYRYGEKEVALIEPPSRFFVRNHGNMMEAFGGMSENEGVPKELFGIEESNNTLRSDKRPPVRLKFSNVNKSLPSSDVFGIKKRDEKSLTSFFKIEAEKDETKSWAEEPLKESMETQQLDSTEL